MDHGSTVLSGDKISPTLTSDPTPIRTRITVHMGKGLQPSPLHYFPNLKNLPGISQSERPPIFPWDGYGWLPPAGQRLQIMKKIFDKSLETRSITVGLPHFQTSISIHRLNGEQQLCNGQRATCLSYIKRLWKHNAKQSGALLNPLVSVDLKTCSSGLELQRKSTFWK